MAEAQNTNLQVLIGGAEATETTLATFLADASNTEWLAVDEEGKKVDTYGTPATLYVANGQVAKRFRFVVKQADEPNGVMYSDWMDTSSLLKKPLWEAYVAPAHQISTVQVVLPTIAAGDRELVSISTRFGNHGSLSIENYYMRYGQYVAKNGDTNILAATEIAANYNASFDKVAERLVIATVLSGGASTAVLNTINSCTTATFTKGSKIVTTDTDISGTVSAGDYLRLNASATTADVYKIASISTTTITLSAPYQGATTAFAATAVSYIAAATAGAGTATVKLTGQEQAWRLGIIKYGVTMFKTEVLGMPSAVLVEPSTAATLGSGAGKKVAELEWFAQGNFVDEDRMNVPHLFDAPKYASKSATYATFSVPFYHYEKAQFVDTKSPRTVVLFATTAPSSATYSA